MNAGSKWIAPFGAVAVLGGALFAPALLMPATAQPIQPGQRTTPDPRLRTVLFTADLVVDVPVRRGQITQIVLGDDEQIVGIPISGKGSNCSDETHTWCIAKQGRAAPARQPPYRRRTARSAGAVPVSCAGQTGSAARSQTSAELARRAQRQVPRPRRTARSTSSRHS